jgi:hypothetical protein
MLPCLTTLLLPEHRDPTAGSRGTAPHRHHFDALDGLADLVAERVKVAQALPYLRGLKSSARWGDTRLSGTNDDHMVEEP